MSGSVDIDVVESPSTGEDAGASPAAEHAEVIAIDATVAAAVAAVEAAHESEDAQNAATDAGISADISTGAADAAITAASVADDAAFSAAMSRDDVQAMLDTIPERVALALASLTAPPVEETTIDEVVTEALIPEVEPRGQHWWFRNRIGGRR